MRWGRAVRIGTLSGATLATVTLVIGLPAFADQAGYTATPIVSECPGGGPITAGTGLPTDHMSAAPYEAPCFTIPETASKVTVSVHDDHLDRTAIEVVVQRSQDDDNSSWTFYGCDGSLTLNVFAVDYVSVFPLGPAQAAAYTHGGCINPNAPTTGTITVNWS